METSDRSKIRNAGSNKSAAITAEIDHNFFPRGAIAFFLALIVFFAGVWLLIYGLMLWRQGLL